MAAPVSTPVFAIRDDDGVRLMVDEHGAAPSLVTMHTVAVAVPPAVANCASMAFQTAGRSPALQPLAQILLLQCGRARQRHEADAHRGGLGQAVGDGLASPAVLARRKQSLLDIIDTQKVTSDHQKMADAPWYILRPSLRRRHRKACRRSPRGRSGRRRRRLCRGRRRGAGRSPILLPVPPAPRWLTSTVAATVALS